MGSQVIDQPPGCCLSMMRSDALIVAPVAAARHLRRARSQYRNRRLSAAAAAITYQPLLEGPASRTTPSSISARVCCRFQGDDGRRVRTCAPSSVALQISPRGPGWILADLLA